MRWSRCAVVAVAGMTVAVGLAACGSGGLSNLALVGKAYADTMQTNSAKVAMAVDISTKGQSAHASGVGVADWTTKQAQFSITAPGVAAPVEERAINSTVYVQVPAADRAKTQGKAWVEASISTNANQSQGLDNLIQPDDPQGALQVLQSQSSQVTRVGRAVIDGVSTTHFRATYDMAKAGSGASPTTIQRFVELTGTSTIPVDVWLDSAGRVRRLSLSISVVKLPQGATTTAQAQAELPLRVTITLDLSAFGTPVAVTAPPASEVAPASAVQATA
jgi:hypothetical protein